MTELSLCTGPNRNWTLVLVPLGPAAATFDAELTERERTRRRCVAALGAALKALVAAGLVGGRGGAHLAAEAVQGVDRTPQGVRPAGVVSAYDATAASCSRAPSDPGGSQSDRCSVSVIAAIRAWV